MAAEQVTEKAEAMLQLMSFCQVQQQQQHVQQVSNTTTSTTPSCWWPSLIFNNMVELQKFCSQYNVCQDSKSKVQMILLYGKHEYAKIQPPPRVALLLGNNPPVRLMFHLPPTKPLTLKDFWENLFEFNEMYRDNPAYCEAVLGIFGDETTTMTAAATTSSAAVASTNQPRAMETSAAAEVATTSRTMESENPQKPAAKTPNNDDGANTSEGPERTSESTKPAALPNEKASALPHGEISDQTNLKTTKSAAAACEAKNTTHNREASQDRSVQDPSVSEKVPTARSTRSKSSAPLKKDPPPNRASQRLSGGSGKKKSSASKRKNAPKSQPSKMAQKKAKSAASSISKDEMVEVDIPTFAAVQPLLEKAGFSFKLSLKQYCRPTGERFDSEDAFRRDLCAYGVECACGSTGDEDTACECWTADEKYLVYLFVRYTIIRGEVFDETYEMDEVDAKKLLDRIGYDPYTYGRPSEMWRKLSRFGLPESCNITEISVEERLALEYFISSHPKRTETFKRTEKDAPAPEFRSPWEVSPDGGGRRTRTSMLSVMDDSATVISAVSNATAATSHDASQKKSKRKSMASMPSAPAMLLEPDSQRLVSFSSIDSMMEPEPLPDFEGTDIEKLRACLQALKASIRANRPTFGKSKQSPFNKNIKSVSAFLENVLNSRGLYGGNEGEPAALYVCGVPGIGKTSGVTWCCNYALEACKKVHLKPYVCHINATHLLAVADPKRRVLNHLGKCLGIKGDNPPEIRIERKLKHLGDDLLNNNMMILIVDEIDALHGHVGSLPNKILSWIMDLANGKELQLALIGICNSMNNEKSAQILKGGRFKEALTFGAYGADEIVDILEARVGRTVIDPNALTFIGKRVSTTTGDARKALEMASNAVLHRLKQTAEGECSAGCLVKMPNVVRANPDETSKLKERIEGQPLIGKVILCVLTALAQGGIVKSTISELKKFVIDCMESSGDGDELVQTEDFMVLLETLVDCGLLRASTDGQSDDSLNLSELPMQNVYNKPIYLGTQLEEVQKVLTKQLKQPYFQRLRDQARSRRRDLDRK